MARRLLPRIAAATVTAAATAAITSPSAAASAIYNLSENGRPNPVPVRLDCGLVCGNYWEIPAGKSVSRPGKGGPAWIEPTENWGVTELDRLGGACEDIFDKPNLTDRGWQELHKGAGAESWSWTMYGAKGNRRGDYPLRLIKDSRLPGIGCAG